MSNPIYVEYYSHENDYCYMIGLPWTNYAKEIMVLCKISEGYQAARSIAQDVIVKHFNKVTAEKPKEED